MKALVLGALMFVSGLAPVYAEATEQALKKDIIDGAIATLREQAELRKERTDITKTEADLRKARLEITEIEGQMAKEVEQDLMTLRK